MNAATNILRTASNIALKTLLFAAISPLLPIFAMMWVVSLLATKSAEEPVVAAKPIESPRNQEQMSQLTGPSWKQQLAQMDLGSSLDLRATWSH